MTDSSIRLAFRLCVRSRLTLIRIALIRNPWSFGGGAFHTPYRYSFLHLLFRTLQETSVSPFSASGMLPYQLCSSTASAGALMPDYYPCPAARLVSCYALLGRVAASGPTSWLSARSHILCHSARTLGPWRAVRAVPLSGARLSPRVLTPAHRRACVRSSVPFGRLRRPLGDPVALPPAPSREASPKAISGRTRYLRV